MRGNDRDDTTRPEDESFSVRLPDRVRRLFLDFSRTFVYQRVLSHAAARYPVEKLLRFGQHGIGLAVMPVHDGKTEGGKKVEENIVSM
jgi:hypothetical protein